MKKSNTSSLKSPINWRVKYVLSVLLLAFVLEIINTYFGIDLLAYIIQFKWFGILGALFTTLVPILYEIFFKGNKVIFNEGNFFDNGMKAIVHIYNVGKKNGVVCIIVLVVCTLLPASVSAHFHVGGKIIKWKESFNERMSYFEESDINDGVSSANDAPEVDNSVVPYDRDSIDDNVPSKVVDSIDMEGNDIIYGEVFLTDPNRHYILSITELNNLYFLDGEFHVTDWSNPNIVAEQLALYVQSLCSLELPNTFDNKAPVSVLNEIAYVSELEKTLESSDDIDYVLMIRINAWENGYRKYTLARLVSNSMQRYAQEYHRINGDFETIKYYYAYSIFWCFESLKFEEVKPYTKRDIINFISMRYHDIAHFAPENSEDQWRATVLYEAFQSLIN